jgi:hypothetical protein
MILEDGPENPIHESDKVVTGAEMYRSLLSLLLASTGLCDSISGPGNFYRSAASNV